MGRLDCKITLIMGGTSGIGKATVELFVKEGACVTTARAVSIAFSCLTSLQVRDRYTMQEIKGGLRSPKLPPNPEKGIKPIKNQILGQASAGGLGCITS